MRVARKAQAAQFAANVLPIIRDIQAAGHTSLNAIAGQLDARKVATANGGQWRHVQVQIWIAHLLVRDGRRLVPGRGGACLRKRSIFSNMPWYRMRHMERCCVSRAALCTPASSRR
jgi:hypothetical protein